MKERAALLLVCGLFLLVALPWLASPGIEYDEAYFVNPALVTLTGSAAEPHDFCFQTVAPFGHTLPVRTFAYGGALKAWLWAPVFAVFGVSPVTIRLPAILLSLATIVLTWKCARAWLGPRGGAFATALFALDPGLLFNVRCDTGPVALAMLCSAGSLRAFQLALERRSARWFAITCGVVALGFYDKLTYVWTATGLVAAAVLVHGKDLLALVRGREKGLALGGAALVATCFSVFAWLLLRGKRTLVGMDLTAKLWSLWNGLRGEGLLHEFQTGATYQRPGFLATLRYDPDALRFQGQDQVEAALPAWFTTLDVLHGTLLPALLVGSLLLLPLVLRTASRAQRRIGAFLALACVADQGLLLVAQGTGLPHHFPLAFPFPQLLIAFVFARAPWVLVAQLVLCLFVDARYVASYASDGGNGCWSDASAKLCADLRADGRRPVFLDWGMQVPWIVFSGRERPSRELAFDPVGAAGEVDAVTRAKGLADLDAGLEEEIDRRAGNVFVTCDGLWQWYPSLERLRELAGKRGLRPVHEAVVRQRDGRPAFHLWSLANR